MTQLILFTIYILIQQEENQLPEPNTHKLAPGRWVGSGRNTSVEKSF